MTLRNHSTKSNSKKNTDSFEESGKIVNDQLELMEKIHEEEKNVNNAQISKLPSSEVLDDADEDKPF
jgi:hypothetical protein